MIEQLQESLEYEQEEKFSEQAAKSRDRTNRTFRSTAQDVHRPDRKEMENNWALYRDFGLVRASIRGFASEVISPGYYVDAEGEKVREDLEDWLESCGIVAGEHDKDFREIAKKATIQREVRGTALVEKVPTENGSLYGFKMVNPEKVKAYTKPNQAILLAPDEDVEALVERHDNFDEDDIVRTENGEVAAYVQWDASLETVRNTKSEIPFTKDQIIKLTRDEDVGEIFGNSRLDSVKERAESLLEKLENNDDAIRATAHPFWLFKMGGEDDPWTEEEIREFMNAHKGEEFAPGMKQAVQGNVDLETHSGDVADIQEFLDFDVNMIMSEMPIPKYALGAFEEDVNQFVSRSQETELRKQVREARSELQSEFTDVLKEKAEELGHSADDVNSLVIGVPPEDRPPVEGEEDQRTDDVGDPEPAAGEERPASEREPETDPARPPASTEMAEMYSENVRGSSEFTELSSLTAQFFTELRDNVLLELERHDGLLDESGVGFRESQAQNIDKMVERQVNRVSDSFNFETSAMEVFSSVVEDEREILSGRRGISGFGSTAVGKQDVRNYAGNYRNSVEDYAEEFASDVRTQFRRSFNRGEDLDTAVERVRDTFNDDAVAQRASIIAHMEVHHARQNARLEAFEAADDIIGYRVRNDSPSTELTESLDGTEVFFEEGDYSEQVDEQVADSLFPVGFHPPSAVPPYRYGDTSTIEPIFEGEV